MAQRKTWTRRWAHELADGPAGESRAELDQFLMDLGGILVQSGGTVTIGAHRVQVGEEEYITSHIIAVYDAYAPGLNLVEAEEGESEQNGAEPEPPPEPEPPAAEAEPAEAPSG